jgi:hypothetical protein
MTIAPETIAQVMALTSLPTSLADLDLRVRRWLPKSALRLVVEQASRTTEERQSLLF